ncbi:uncharacterized protein LOC106674064 [Cimex lectularius]|uniref:Ras-GEF domain-containing family member 1B n=1 Tax=Cimex lectularius TaxID=79782 RepID=A0A8I6SCV3_CIMLE|nr:uncharacterized protein LOC106674064 [Cimex lectularius]
MEQNGSFSYGSTFRPPPENKPRGGVQVLPPLVPPRAPGRTKPKPPVPPKRDQLTRLTTVPNPPPRDEAKPLEALERKINSSPPKKPNYENTADIEPPLYAAINPDTKKMPNSDSKGSLKSPKDSSSDDEGAIADIWVRTIDSPVKKTDRVFRSNSISEEREDKPPKVHRASIDNSLIKSPPILKLDKPEVIIENRDGEKANAVDKESKEFERVKPVDKEIYRIKNLERETEKLKVGNESLPGSRPSSRTTSRSSSPFGDKEKKKISAAEALGVVAKPCPRPPPGKRVKNQLEFRRQSLGNLSDSKLSMGCSTSCPSHQLWSSFGECQENEYKRHERARGQSADSRTLQRLKNDTWETHSYSSTLSRIGKYSTTKYFTKTSTCPAATDRPKSTCNCGRHTGQAPQRDVGKRTFSVEELRSGFVRGSNTTGSARSSFGKSPRVTFALSEDEGASALPKSSENETRRMSTRARSYDADDRFQSNRSQPAIGLKQTPKARPTIFGTVASDQTPKDSTTCRRSLPQTTPPGVSNGAESVVPHETNASQDNAVMYREGNLVSGRLEALVQHMVPTVDYYPDRAFLFAFLLTSRLFIKPHDLLGQIFALSESQLKAKNATAKERAQLLPRLVQLLGEWSETFPYDFRDERVMSHVRDVAQRCVTVEGPVRQEISLLLHNLLYRLKKLEQYEAFLHSIHTEATASSLEPLSQTEVQELCGSAVSLAQQLTHIEIERLSYIGPEEFVQAFAKDSPALETSFKDMKQTRNLESYVSWFNRLSYFVATEVCKHVKSKKQRVRIVEFWVETARECFNIGNFNSLMAIIAGLNMSPVSRLKRTWSKVQCAKFSVLEHQMDPSCNFSSYRSTLKAAVWRSAAAKDESQKIVIPFFSLLVKDLYFLNEGCSNKLPNGHINFEKFWQLAKQVTEFITWKQVHCPFPKSAKVITYLQATPVLNEDALALASFECEPPENHEKERYKTLKAELGSTN